MFTIVAVAIGIVIGLLRGGRLENLRGVHVVAWPVLAVGFSLQLFAEVADIGAALTMSITALFAMVVGLVLNSRIRGTIVAAVGVFANLVVTVANGHVPTRFEALVEVGKLTATDAPSAVTLAGLRKLETSGSTLAFLGDVIPLPIFGIVVSYGDLITHAGIIVIAQGLLTSRRRKGISVDDLFIADADADSTTEPIHELVAERSNGNGESSFVETEFPDGMLDLTTPDLQPEQPVQPNPDDIDLRPTAPAEPIRVPARSPFENGTGDGLPFDYGEPDEFNEGLGPIRPLSR